jgi:hypothetical protein
MPSAFESGFSRSSFAFDVCFDRSDYDHSATAIEIGLDFAGPNLLVDFVCAAIAVHLPRYAPPHDQRLRNLCIVSHRFTSAQIQLRRG